MESQKKSIGEKIRELREKRKRAAKSSGDDWRKWTQSSIANELKVETTTYQRWESGDHTPGIPFLSKLSEILEVPAGYLISDNEIPYEVNRPADMTTGEAKILEELGQFKKYHDEVIRLQEQLKEAKNLIGSHQPLLLKLKELSPDRVEAVYRAAGIRRESIQKKDQHR